MTGRQTTRHRAWHSAWLAAVLVALTAGFSVGPAAQDGVLPDDEFRRLALGTKTPQDHAKLATHYTAHAAVHERDATLHDEVGKQYEKTAPSVASEARHYAGHSREAAEAMRNLAKIHDSMGKGGK